MGSMVWIKNTLTILLFLNEAMCNPHAKRLYDDLLNNYNRLIRPVSNNTEKLTVKLGLKLSQLIDVDLKNQIMTTNLWVVQKWRDYKLQWNPEEYGGVEMMYVPSQDIWLPDIVLFNNADGKYEVTLMTKATLSYTGEVSWKPPAIYKSSCKINVEWFPFDEQSCDMKFGSWTYDGHQVDLKHIDQEKGSNVVDVGIDLKEFYLSVEWDILAVPATRNEEYFAPTARVPDEYDDDSPPEGEVDDTDNHGKLLTDITFIMTLRRKTLFYTVNLIIPCVGISFLTVLVFYLPSDSGEKVTLCVSILLSLTVFFLLLAEIIPPTSLAIPLLGKYLLFTMILVTLSICVTVGVLNIHFRSPSTHRMSPWARKIFIHIMPRILLMRRPNYMPRYSNEPPGVPTEKISLIDNSGVASFGASKLNGHAGNEKLAEAEKCAAKDLTSDYDDDLLPPEVDKYKKASQSVKTALRGVEFIAQHIKDADKDNEVIEDWKYIAMVLDRLFLWLFTAACFLGTAGIIFRAPSLYDMREPIDAKLSEIPKF